MSPRDVLIATSLGGSLLGVSFMALGTLMLSAATNVSNQGNAASLDLLGGSVLFLSGSAFLLFSAILIPALRAIRAESTQSASGPPRP